MANHIATITKLANEKNIDIATLTELLEQRNDGLMSFISVKARKAMSEAFDGKITIKGAVSISSVCKGDCFFCGIRKSNMNCKRFTLTADEIIERVAFGYEKGIRHFELRGGENEEFSDSELCATVSKIKEAFPDAEIELALGQKKYSSLLSYFRVGVKGYTLRFEASNNETYSRLCPTNSIDQRQISIAYLKQVGFESGTGFLVGAPFKKAPELAQDILYIKESNPDVIDISPFIPHKDTPLAKFKAGSAEETLFVISLLRLLCPNAKIVANESLDVLMEKGRKMAMTAGANVVTVSLDTADKAECYNIYDSEIEYIEPEKVIAKTKSRIEKFGFKAN